MVYEFECRACKDRFEKIMPVKRFTLWKENKDIECPKCKSTDIDTVVSTVPVHFKSGGFSSRVR